MTDSTTPLNNATSSCAEQTAACTPSCCVVIPCYNEAERLPIAEYEAYLERSGGNGIRLLLVNDGSKDRTLDVLSALRDRFPEQIGILDQQPNRGKAEAVRRGMLEVMREGWAEITGFWDADLATPLAQIEDMRSLIADRADLDMVFGSRVKLLGRDIQRKALRHYLGRCFATAVSQLLNLPIYDSQCGAKLFRITPDLGKVLAQPFHSRWVFDVEIVTRFLELQGGDVEQMKKRLYEYPLPKWTDVEGSKVHASDFLRSFGEVAAIYSQYRRNLRQQSAALIAHR